MTQNFSINGWINLRSQSPIIINSGYNQVDLNTIVTNANEITIYLDQGRCYDEEEKQYHKTYKSTYDGFTHYDVLGLIHKTYWLACRDIWNNDKDFFSNLALHTFEFDPDTNTVYPSTDS